MSPLLFPLRSLRPLLMLTIRHPSRDWQAQRCQQYQRAAVFGPVSKSWCWSGKVGIITGCSCFVLKASSASEPAEQGGQGGQLPPSYPPSKTCSIKGLYRYTNPIHLIWNVKKCVGTTNIFPCLQPEVNNSSWPVTGFWSRGPGDLWRTWRIPNWF